MPTHEQKDPVIEARDLARTPMEAHQFARRSRELLKTLSDEVEALRERFSVTCGNCGERYLGPKDERLHGYNICNMSRCGD